MWYPRGYILQFLSDMLHFGGAGGGFPPLFLHPLQPVGPGTLTWCGGMVGSPQSERTGIGGQPRCRSSALLRRSFANSR